MLAQGTRIDRYEIEGFLGKGGMGVVYAARDPQIARTVAIKLVRLREGADGASREALIAEARAMARVSHPAVVVVYDAGRFGDEVFIAMEHVTGETLAAWLERARRPWREVVTRLVAVGRGLAAAHAAGIVHGDVKPDNILVDGEGRARITDFGLARELGTEVTQTGGTPAYLSPELHLGRAGDARSDQWSFCVALWEGVYGERPFAARSGVDAAAALQLAAETSAGRIRPPPRGAGVPAWLERILRRGLSVDPDRRWPSMAALLDALEAAPRRRRTLAAAAVAGAALLAAVAVTASVSSPRDPCRDAVAAIDAIYGAADRTRVGGALAAIPRGYAPAVAAQTLGTLDAWAAGWRAQRAETCRASVRGELPDAARVAACLDDELVTLRARVALLAAATTAETVDRAHEIADLPETRGCLRAPADALPEDPARRRQVEGFRERLAAVDALRAAGRAREAEPWAEALLVEAAALDRPLDRARALLAAARISSWLSRYDRAVTRLRAAAEIFTASATTSTPPSRGATRSPRASSPTPSTASRPP